MEIFIQRIPLISEQIFEQLDFNSLKNCREVTISWKTCIDNKNLSWIQIVQIPQKLKRYEKCLQMAIKSGQTKVFETILEREKDDISINEYGQALFHMICTYGNSKMAEMLIQRSDAFKIKLNAKGVCTRMAQITCYLLSAS